jgi:proline iminopeptidase
MRVCVNGTELYVDVEGAQLRLAEGGLVKRPTVVVLHGGPGYDQGYLRPGLGPISADAQLVFVDLRGHGRSSPVPAESCTLEQMADDVARLCERLEIDAPVVFGHSAGGFVALRLALRHPGSVGGLILCGTAPTLAPLPDADPPPSLEQRAPAEAVEVAGRLFGGDFSAEAYDDFVRSVLPYYAGPQHIDLPNRLMRLSGVALDIAAYFFGTLAAAYDVRPSLPEIAVPTLVISGGYDWVCPPVASRVLAAEIPDAQLVEVAEAGHFVFSEEPEAFQQAVWAFLARPAVRPRTPQLMRSSVRG